ncbi:MAG: hypothetical protein ACI977_000192 [Candidatus Nanohaloarchaea archaeon]|jgi:hypothetical protein
MMATTHGLIGVLTALPLYFISPELFMAGVTGAFAGGIFPDLDLYHGHRKMLHYPLYYNFAWMAILPVLLIYPVPNTAAVFFFLLSAGVHCYSDRFGGPKDSRPWKNDSGEAVYSHYHSKWLRPEKIIPYDGSKEDFVVLLLASIPTIYLIRGNLRLITILLVIMSGLYTLFRRKGMKWLPNRFLRNEI